MDRSKEEARRRIYEQAFFESEARAEQRKLRFDFMNAIGHSFDIYDHNWVVRKDGGLEVHIKFSLEGIREYLGKGKMS